jgi:hypothetical protein
MSDLQGGYMSAGLGHIKHKFLLHGVIVNSEFSLCQCLRKKNVDPLKRCKPWNKLNSVLAENTPFREVIRLCHSSGSWLLITEVRV